MRSNRVPRYEDTEINGITKRSFAGNITLPSSSRAVVSKAMFRIATLFTVLAMAVSAAAIGHLFSTVIPALIAYPAAALFDGLWIFALLGEWLSAQTRNGAAQTASQSAGLVFMGASMAAIIAEAYSLGYVLAGVFLAMVPAAVKGGWWTWFEITKLPELPAKWANRLQDDRAELSVQLEVAETQYELEAHRLRLTELREAQSQLHPAQGDGYEITEVSGADLDEATEKVSELVSGSAQELKAQRLEDLRELLAVNPELTPAQAMEEVGVSLATAKRYLKEIRS